ncbi:MAG TPA: RtcB family protein [Thermoanaerobaculia bacterium]|jgi:tRNA-splicing ligase RtcB
MIAHGPLAARARPDEPAAATATMPVTVRRGCDKVPPAEKGPVRAMKRRELIKLGFGSRELADAAIAAVAAAARAGLKKTALRRRVHDLAASPEAFLGDQHFGELAAKLVDRGGENADAFVPRRSPAPYRQWGRDVDPEAVRQMENACALPVAARGALMADAHVGYGLPIGGVLATRDAVIPFAVGVDIACRMKLSVVDLPPKALEGQTDRLRNALESETRFGIGAAFRQRRSHDVLDEDWTVSPVTQRLKDKAWSQLGTSGSGNHFVEYGVLAVDAESELGLAPGEYLAILSHSGSRGVGAAVADWYSKLAMELHPELPKQLRHLAWLDLGSEPGQEYWRAMELMGDYASANHAEIHRHLARALGVEVLASVENHHNFAWREEHGGETLIVHRKGATPAAAGDFGVIPGSMASPAFVVRGRGSDAALRSASHGAGRVMSRKKAKESFTWSQARRLLRERGVTLLSAGLDEVPMAYRDIGEVMAAQADLVETLAVFEPRMVKMAPAGERPED